MGASALCLVPPDRRQREDAILMARPGLIVVGVVAGAYALPTVLVVAGIVLLLVPLALIAVGSALA